MKLQTICFLIIFVEIVDEKNDLLKIKFQIFVFSLINDLLNLHIIGMNI